jgi:hypothetical protein
MPGNLAISSPVPTAGHFTSAARRRGLIGEKWLLSGASFPGAILEEQVRRELLLP